MRACGMARPGQLDGDGGAELPRRRTPSRRHLGRAVARRTRAASSRRSRSAAIASSDTSIWPSRVRADVGPPQHAVQAGLRARRSTCAPAQAAGRGGTRPARGGPGRRPAAAAYAPRSAPSSAASGGELADAGRRARPVRRRRPAAGRAPGRPCRAGRRRRRRRAPGRRRRRAGRRARGGRRRSAPRRGRGGRRCRFSSSSSPGSGADRLDLGHPVREQVRLAAQLGGARDPVGELGARRPASASNAAAHAAEVDAGEAVERGALRSRSDETLLVALAVHGDQVLGQLAQHGHRDGGPAGVGARPAAGGDHPAQHQLGSSVGVAAVPSAPASTVPPASRTRCAAAPSGSTSNRPSTEAWSAPVRTRAASARAPNSSMQPGDDHRLAGAGLPRDAVSPGPSGSTASSMTPRPLIRSSSSISVARGDPSRTCQAPPFPAAPLIPLVVVRRRRPGRDRTPRAGCARAAGTSTPAAR